MQYALSRQRRSPLTTPHFLNVLLLNKARRAFARYLALVSRLAMMLSIAFRNGALARAKEGHVQNRCSVSHGAARQPGWGHWWVAILPVYLSRWGARMLPAMMVWRRRLALPSRAQGEHRTLSKLSSGKPDSSCELRPMTFFFTLERHSVASRST